MTLYSKIISKSTQTTTKLSYSQSSGNDLHTRRQCFLWIIRLRYYTVWSHRLPSFLEVLGHPWNSIIMESLHCSIFPERVTVWLSNLSVKIFKINYGFLMTLPMFCLASVSYLWLFYRTAVKMLADPADVVKATENPVIHPNNMNSYKIDKLYSFGG